MWALCYTYQAKIDARKLVAAGLKQKALALLDVIRNDPDQIHPLMKN